LLFIPPLYVIPVSSYVIPVSSYVIPAKAEIQINKFIYFLGCNYAIIKQKNKQRRDYG